MTQRLYVFLPGLVIGISWSVQAIDDHHRLSRFVKIQDTDNSYQIALQEIRQGKKESHWIWYIFPQHFKLGKSSMSMTYGIKSIDEARAYLNHPILGKRLIECCEALLAHKTRSAWEIFGSIDCQKVKSSMTLFAHVAQDKESIFHKILAKHYNGDHDDLTLNLLSNK